MFASGAISVGFEFKYQSSTSTSDSSDCGLQITVGPLPGTDEAPYAYSAYDAYTVMTYQLAPDERYAQWLFADLGADSSIANLAPNAQPWKIVYLVSGNTYGDPPTVNGYAIPSPMVLPATSGWAGDLNTDSCPNPPWTPGYQVRYAVSFYGGTDPNTPDWESPKGPWTDWLSSEAYCRAILQGLPTAPDSWSWKNGIGRKVYRQFLGSSPEYICNIPDNRTTTFVDPVSPGECGS